MKEIRFIGSAMTFDGETWSGWSSQSGLTSIEEAVSKIRQDPELGFRIIDASSKKIWVSDEKFIERAIASAKTNYNVDIPRESIHIGYP